MEYPAYKKVVLLILDGFGIASSSHGNAIALAEPVALDRMVAEYPAISLLASGPVVGLPWGEVGNSEVGHLNIGAGRIVGQDLPRINAAIQDRTFFKNQTFIDACDHVKKNNSKLHLIGLASIGGVHSSEEHLYALLGLAAEQGVKEVYIHMFSDGRDTGQKVALDTVKKINHKIQEIGVGTIATITGRFYAMDRANHWDQTEMTYQVMTTGAGAAADTDKIAFAPRLDLLGVLSAAIINSSNILRLVTDFPFKSRLILIFTLRTAFCTPKPANRFLSPSLSSKAS